MGSKEDSHLLSAVASDGLSAMTASERNEGEHKARRMVFIMWIVQPLFGLCVACAINKFGNTALYAEKTHQVIANGMVYFLLSTVVISRLVAWLNLYPMIYKSRVMKSAARNIRANMIIYEMIGNNVPAGKVVMVEDGDCGVYNRANRSMHHFNENLGGFLATLLPATFIYPFPAFVLVCLYALGRVLHQVGYTKGYGSHGLGFGLSNMVAGGTLEGLVWLAILKSCGAASM
eukprot:gb/GEZN01015059.1/.p1 GENE.gb/GEZN01015059.1/~~gb/GEZN01015059.1/.p1  ORF type:complete len:232 (-),score=25.56 gb/GEZN01015059.1/:187-882(-)